MTIAPLLISPLAVDVIPVPSISSIPSTGSILTGTILAKNTASYSDDGTQVPFPQAGGQLVAGGVLADHLQEGQRPLQQFPEPVLTSTAVGPNSVEHGPSTHEMASARGTVADLKAITPMPTTVVREPTQTVMLLRFTDGSTHSRSQPDTLHCRGELSPIVRPPGFDLTVPLTWKSEDLPGIPDDDELEVEFIEKMARVPRCQSEENQQEGEHREGYVP